VGEKEFISAGGDGQVVRWNPQQPEEGKVIAKVNSTIYGLLVDGDRLVVGENSRAIHLIDLSTNKVMRSVEIKSPMFAIQRLDDRYLVGTGAGEIFVFDLSMNYLAKIKHSTKSVRAFALHASDLAVAYSDNSIRILNPIDFSLKYELAGHSLSVFAVSYHPTQHWLVSTGRDAHIRAWDTYDHYKEIKTVPAHMYASNHLAFHPNGNYFATGSMDKTIKIWDATTFALLKVIDKARHGGHSNSVNKLLWMDFDNLLVTCSDDRTIAVWDIKFD
jgi:WD40 repeat protein